ncbi:hypothetical protein [Yinghuangia seranimata]|uniref:hypothetical protein n=1 Tax=Yinghuangia seranimata TaxID=408067 RepID=UPI00248B683D|nr:hypothetical protein [Yinghuangia seranimata]MDI2126011.1 hypothetical protein [Yinghuangia seranimata]
MSTPTSSTAPADLPDEPRPTPPAASVDDPGRPDARLARLWRQHLRRPFPARFRGVDIAGVELILLDAAVAGLVQRELDGGLDDAGVAWLWGCIADVDKVGPLIDDEYCASYFAKLRAVARLAVERYTPGAT